MKKLLVVVLVLSIAGFASAGPVPPEAGLFTNATADGMWHTPGNWDTNSVPVYGPSPDFGTPALIGAETPLIVAGDSAGASNLTDVGGVASVVNQTGGTLQLHGYYFGANGGGATYNLSGGTLLTDGAWATAAEIGAYGGEGQLLVTGSGYFEGPGTLQIGSQEGTGHLGIDDNGIVKADDICDFTYWKNTNGTLDISGNGRLILTGNQKLILFDTGTGSGKLLLGIIAGNITANGVAFSPGAFNVWYDSASDTTIINAPEPATIALLGMGAMALIRRKR